MKVGYDGLLYHLPHQNFVKDYKIIFGLFNLHERFGIISLYGYISSLFWIGNDLKVITYLQGCFYFILFYSLKDYIFHKQILKKIIGLSTLIFFPIWIRFVDPSYSLVDIPSSIIFIITFFLGVNIILNKKSSNSEIKFFFLSSALLYCLKTSYLIFILYVFIIFLIFIKKNKFKNTKDIIFLSIPILLVVSWTLKSFINTGCLIFPIKYTCFDLIWADLELTNIIYNEIINFGKIYINSLNKIIIFKDFYIEYIIYLIFITILFFYLFSIKLEKKILNLLIKLLIFINLLIIIQQEPITGFTNLIKNSNLDHLSNLNNLLLKELSLIIIGLIFSIFITYYTFFKYKKKIININNLSSVSILSLNNFQFLIPIFFCILFNLFWFYSSPNPRFAIGYFAIIPSSFLISLIYFYNNFHITNINFDKKIMSIIFFSYISITSIMLIKNNFEINDIIKIPKKDIQKIHTFKREGFGVSPFDCNKLNESTFCGIEKNCYFIEKDAIIYYQKFNYILFKKINDRKHPNCIK